jgi:asparagine synthase (glutamine-hydrolysing)
VWRKNKIGFEAPVKTWLSSSTEINQAIQQSPLLNKIMKEKKPEQWDNKLKWKLYNIARWEKLFNVQ